jgi:hypothetical protein
MGKNKEKQALAKKIAAKAEAHLCMNKFWMKKE